MPAKTGIVDLLTADELTNFARRFLAEVIDARGFGVPSKSEIEVIVFDELLKSDALCEKQNYQLATLLRIPESKIKMLQLTAGIRHSPPDHRKCVQEVFERCLAYETIKQLEQEQKVALGIENAAKRREVEHAIKDCGETPEYGTNREILIFRPHTLLALLAKYLDDAAEKKFVEWLSGQLKEQAAIAELSKRGKSLSSRVADALNKSGDTGLKVVLEQGVKLAFSAAVAVASAN
jgi:hypothetical protein